MQLLLKNRRHSTMSMTKKERCMAAVKGEKPDRIPYSLWSHMPQFDHDPKVIAEKTYEFYKKYDIDFIKTMNNGMYSIEDFGAEIDYSEIAKGGMAKLVSTPIHSAEDWTKLEVKSLSEGALARELYHLQLLVDKVKAEDVPVIFTVFSPISTANKLCGGNIGKYIHEGHGKEVKAALEVICETTVKLAEKAIEIGASGVFFASQMSNYTNALASEPLTVEDYKEYGKPYDVKILEAANAAGGWMNAIHCHGDDIMFDVVKDYPVQIFNWHIWETFPALDEVLAVTDKCVMGGMKRFDITECNYNAIRHQIYECCRLTKGRRMILTPGCVIRYPLNDEMLSYIKTTKDSVEEALGLI